MDHLRHNLTYQFEFNICTTKRTHHIVTPRTDREMHALPSPRWQIPPECVPETIAEQMHLQSTVSMVFSRRLCNVTIFPIEPTKTQNRNQINLLNNNNSVLRRCRFRFLKFAIRRIQIKHKSQFVRTVHNANRFQVDHINFVENLFKRLVHIRQQNV